MADDSYKIAAGWDNTAGLTTLTPQPKCPGIKDGIRRIGGDGLTNPDGWQSTSLLFEYHSPNKRDISALLSQLGVNYTGTPSAKVTITLRNNGTNTFGNYNAVITVPDLPDQGRYEFAAYQDLEFPLTNIHGAS